MSQISLIYGQLAQIIAPIIALFAIGVLSDHIIDAIKRVMSV